MRQQNWPSRLNEEIDRYRKIPFKWGVNDCALFAADCVKNMTGQDYAAPFRGRYNTKLNAFKALRKYGKGTLQKTLNEYFKQIPIFAAQRGDVVMWEGAIGVCLGTKAAFLTKNDGIRFISTNKCAKAWSVE